MMPLWAHGLFSKSPAYKNSSMALEAVKKFREQHMNVSGLVLPIDYENLYFATDANSSLVQEIRKVYPSAADL
jgi:hypothetical protein